MEINEQTSLVPDTAINLNEASASLKSAKLEFDGESPVIRDVVLIEAGTSANRRNYPERVLREDGPQVFEGAPCYATNHRKEQKNFNSLVGYFRNVRFEEGKLKADLYGFPSHAHVLQKAIEAEQALGSDRVGLSIDTVGEIVPTAGGKAQEVARLYRSTETSVDLVINPAARGRFTESELELDNMDKELIEDAEPTAVEETELEEVAAEVVEAIEEVKEVVEAPVVEAQPEIDVEALVEAKVAEKLALAERTRLLESKLDAAKDLGKTHLELVREHFSGKDFSAEDIDARISALREEIGKRSANKINVPNSGANMQINESHDKKYAALEGMLLGTRVNGVKPFSSLTEALYEYEGINPLDHNGKMNAFARAMSWGGTLNNRVSEAVTSSTFDQAFADVLYKAIMKEANNPDWTHWKEWTIPVSFDNLTHSKKMVYVGGYGNFPSVAEGGTYTAATSPGDRQVSFVPSKYGNIESITWESILADDLRVLQKLPTKLGLAWARTCHDLVYGALQANAAMDYDTVALYHTASHANIVDDPLSIDSLREARNLMRAQAELSSGKKLGLRPGYLLVAQDLDETAYELVGVNVKNTTTSDSTKPNFFAAMGIKAIPVIYPTATSVRAELVCRKEDMDTFYVGALNGNFDPEIFVADANNIGSMLNADKIDVKTRGTFGVQPANHEAFVRIEDTVAA